MPAIESITGPVSTGQTKDMMKALVYGGPGQRAWQAKPRPLIRDPGDAVVRITTSTICGTELHIMKGDVPTVTPGRILGHEGVGVIEAVGPLVSTFRQGDRVLRILPFRHGSHVPHARIQEMKLPHGRINPRSHDRWYASRVRAHPPRRYEFVSPASGRR